MKITVRVPIVQGVWIRLTGVLGNDQLSSTPIVQGHRDNRPTTAVRVGGRVGVGSLNAITLSGWTVRLLVPRHKTVAVGAYETAFREQLLTPLRPAVLDELRWYFRERHNGRPSDEPFDHADRAFGAPRFRILYDAWWERGDVVLEATLSHVLSDAVARGSGGLETYVLAHTYQRLLPLVGTA